MAIETKMVSVGAITALPCASVVLLDEVKKFIKRIKKENIIFLACPIATIVACFRPCRYRDMLLFLLHDSRTMVSANDDRTSIARKAHFCAFLHQLLNSTLFACEIICYFTWAAAQDLNSRTVTSQPMNLNNLQTSHFQNHFVRHFNILTIS